MIDKNNRWLPPSPHREAVLDTLRRGRAHVEERGHNNPPLLVFQDGGVLELPRARWKGKGDGFYQDASEEAGTRQTKHCDICGTLDELKQLLVDSPELAETEPDRLLKLVDDVEYMLSRLVKRRQDYESFVSTAAAALEKARSIQLPDVPGAHGHAAELRNAIETGADQVRERVEGLHDHAERFRDVANASERVVRDHREAALAIGHAFETVRGGRSWDEAGK